jgi:membrane-bound inhibitor of C-type lysozyme
MAVRKKGKSAARFARGFPAFWHSGESDLVADSNSHEAIRRTAADVTG